MTEVFPTKLAATMELAVASAIVAVSLGIASAPSPGPPKSNARPHTRDRVHQRCGDAAVLVRHRHVDRFLGQIGVVPDRTQRSGHLRVDRHPTGLYTVDSLLALDFKAFSDAIWHLILPAVTLGYGATAIIARMMRSSLVEELQEDYVDAARAKGLPERLVLRRHARRNALMPTVTVIGLSFGFLLQGTVVAEIIFRWPGLGRWMADSVLRGDQATIMAYVLFTSILFLVVNLIVDVVYAYLDRRVVLGG